MVSAHQDLSAGRSDLCLKTLVYFTLQLHNFTPHDFIFKQLINCFHNYVTTWKYCWYVKCQPHATEVCWCWLINVWVKKAILQQIRFICIQLHTCYSWSVEEWWQLCPCHSQVCWCCLLPGVLEESEMYQYSCFWITDRLRNWLAVSANKANGRREGISTVARNQGTSQWSWGCYLIYSFWESHQTIE